MQDNAHSKDYLAGYEAGYADATKALSKCIFRINPINHNREGIVLRILRDNPGMTTRDIHAEMIRQGHQGTRQTVKAALRALMWERKTVYATTMEGERIWTKETRMGGDPLKRQWRYYPHSSVDHHAKTA